ncbi:hypothetical protein BJ912DRAFT_949260 [Pholiota molesta]|nr:hypothetical protein BJ912DRAFT_949260 [Pholiota molesta]
MLPRFSNPHFLPQSTETITRAEIYADDAEDVYDSSQVDPKSIEELNRLIKHSIPKIRYEVPTDAEVGHGSKTLDQNDATETEGESLVCMSISFGISSQPPLPVSLLPPPPPPSKTREPDAEDTEARAALRKQYAEAASVDGADILRESQILKVGNLHTWTCVIPDTEPCMMIIRTLQNPRKTRPPVPPLQLTHYPYVSDKSKIPPHPSTSKTLNVPPLTQTLRRRGIVVEKERPPPQFWRPNPNLKGKCRGYAYGYPSNLSLVESCGNGGGSGPWKYKRDTMKKGAYIESSTASQVTYGYGPNRR